MNRLNGDWKANTTLNWPKIPRPPPKCWAIFRWFISKAFARKPGRYNQHTILDHPLGRWFQVERNIKYETTRNQDGIYLQKNGTILCYKSTDNPRIFTLPTNETCIPNDTHPIEATIGEEEAWTSHRYKLDPAMNDNIESPIDYEISTNDNTLSGADGSVDIVTGDRACAYCVQINGRRYGGAHRYPPSQHSTIDQN